MPGASTRRDGSSAMTACVRRHIGAREDGESHDLPKQNVYGWHANLRVPYALQTQFVAIRETIMRSGLASVLLLAAFPAFGEIVIGQSAPLSGSNAELGTDIRNGALAYFKKVNDAGGLPQGRIELVTLDDHNDAQVAAENTRKLVADPRTVALFGYGSSTLSIPSMPAVQEARLPFFAPFTGSYSIRKQNKNNNTNRATYA